MTTYPTKSEVLRSVAPTPDGDVIQHNKRQARCRTCHRALRAGEGIGYNTGDPFTGIVYYCPEDHHRQLVLDAIYPRTDSLVKEIEKWCQENGLGNKAWHLGFAIRTIVFDRDLYQVDVAQAILERLPEHKGRSLISFVEQIARQIVAETPVERLDLPEWYFVKGFYDFSEAFDYCREASQPIVVYVKGEKWKLYPSGAARKLESNREDN